MDSSNHKDSLTIFQHFTLIVFYLYFSTDFVALHNFYNLLCDKAHTKYIQLKEYSKEKWTFHAKGLWLFGYAE